MRGRTKDLLVGLAAGAVISALVYWSGAAQSYSFLRCLCDAFFVAAVMLLGLGGIRFVANKGIFDVTGYGLKITVETFIPALRGEEKEDIHRYREKKAAKRRSPRGLLLAGSVYLLLSIIVLAVYELLK